MMTRDEKIVQYYGLIEVILDKLLTTPYYQQYRYMRDDLHGEGMLGLIDAIDTFDPERKVKEVSYVSLKVRGYVINLIRKQRKYKAPLIDIDNRELENMAAPEPKEEEDDYTLVDRYEPTDTINKAVYNQCIMGTVTCQSVADEFGLSRDSVQKRKRRLLKRLKKQIIIGEEQYED
jgi:RNA polymerase sigma factor (sigma-70 family)